MTYCWVPSKQIREVERALKALQPHIDIPGISDARRELYAVRGRIMKNLGLKYPRTISALLKLAGLSPGTITLWHDIEGGWMTSARARAGAPPVYHYVSDAVAISLLSHELTHELEATLMAPDDYLGE